MTLDIILPIYRNVDMVRACLDSLVRNLDEIRDHNPRLIAINDSPDDQAVDAYLRRCHAEGLIPAHCRKCWPCCMPTRRSASFVRAPTMPR